MLYRLAHYEIVEEVGHGGMGVVYRARDTKLGRMVAIKVLPSLLRTDAERRSRLLREARAAANLNHPNIATVYEVNEALLIPVDAIGSGVHPTVDSLFIAMEYVDGRDLHDLLADGPLAVAEAIDFGIQIADALDLAHRSGIVHRDLKPRNVRITGEGRVKILDFGLAKVLHDETRIAPMGAALAGESVRTAAGMIVGTVPYMAPEQVDGTEVDARSDLFSLGVVLYQMATGQVPYEGGTLVKFVQALGRGKPKPMRKLAPEIPAGLESVVSRLLARDPAKRHVSAGVVLRELRELEGSGATTLVDTATITVPGWFVGWRRWAAAVGAVLVLVAALALTATRYWQSEPRPLSHTLQLLPYEARGESGTAEKACRDIRLAAIEAVNNRTDFLVAERPQPDTSRAIDLSLSCRQELGGVQVAAKLQELSSGVVLWAESASIVGPAGIDVIEDVAFRIARGLREVAPFHDQSGPRIDARTKMQQSIARGRYLLESFNDPRDLDQAVLVFEQAVERVPDHAPAHAGLSAALWRRWDDLGDSDDYNRAIVAADEALRLDADLLEARIAKARILRVEGSFEESVELLRACVAADSSSELAIRELAHSLVRMGKTAEADQLYRQATTIRPGYWRAWNELGGFLLEKGEWTEAEEMLERARTLAPRDVYWPVENLGTLAYRRGDFDRAIELYQQIPSVDRTASLNNNLGAIYFWRGDYQQSKEFYEKAIRAMPRRYMYWGNLGEVLQVLGQEAEARDALRSAIDLVEEQMRSTASKVPLLSYKLQYLARLGECSDNAFSSDETIRRLRSKEPEPAHVIVRMARAFALCDDAESALDLVERSIEAGMPIESFRSSADFARIVDEPRFLALIERQKTR